MIMALEENFVSTTQTPNPDPCTCTQSDEHISVILELGGVFLPLENRSPEAGGKRVLTCPVRLWLVCLEGGKYRHFRGWDGEPLHDVR